jgi:hypothetical protein
MALSQSALAAALEDVFGAADLTAGEVAELLAAAYADYASEGRFGTSEPEITELQVGALEGPLAGALTDPAAGAAATFAAAWGAGLAAFWLGVPVVGAQAGATVGCPGAASAPTAIAAAVSNPGNTAATAAQGIAAALHTATQTVTASVAPPPGTVLPIS